jgi:hypothetical protein
VCVGQAGTIKDIVNKYKNGELTPASQANAPSHAGTGGMGMGRGRGKGGGGGLGGRGRTGR